MKFILVITTCLLGAYTALACKCAPSTLQEQFDRSSAVFSGTVTKVQNNGPTITATFKVDKSYKGGSDKDSELTVSTASSSSACGYNFEENQSYVGFSQNGKTSLCSGNIKGTPNAEMEEKLNDAAKTPKL